MIKLLWLVTIVLLNGCSYTSIYYRHPIMIMSASDICDPHSELK